MKVLVVLPSFNESQNILTLTEAILALSSDFSICVVDDSSPDGTSNLVQRAIEHGPDWQKRVHLIVRSRKDGRGGAVRDGFLWGITSDESFAAYVEMDCDFSHEPAAIPQGIRLLGVGNDIVIGARYPNGTITGWPLSRRVFSFFANMLARVLIKWSIPDYTNGFRFYSEEAVRLLIDHPQKHKGYIYLSESLSYLIRSGVKVGTFPVYFKNRERGVSNTSFVEICSALRGILSIAWEYHFSKR